MKHGFKFPLRVQSVFRPWLKTPSPLRETSKNLRPLLRVFEHPFAQKRERRRTVAQKFVVEILQLVARALLGLPVGAQLEDHQLAQRVVQVAGIERAAHRLLSRGLLLVVAVLDEELRRVIDAQVLRVQPDRNAQAADAQQRLVGLREAILRGAQFLFAGRLPGIGGKSRIEQHLLSVMRPAFDVGGKFSIKTQQGQTLMISSVG